MQIYQGVLTNPTNQMNHKTLDPNEAKINYNSQFLSEYQSRLLTRDKPDYQHKKQTGRKLITPAYTRHKVEQLNGVGLVVTGQNDKNGDQGSFNPVTLSRYNGRKRQFNEYNYGHESQAIREAR